MEHIESCCGTGAAVPCMPQLSSFAILLLVLLSTPAAGVKPWLTPLAICCRH
ncbi:MAG: hypothetical protein ACLVHV_14960 [Oscillospiraceae bacterium]